MTILYGIALQKLIIVNHKLKGDANGNLLIGPESFDVEVRELWQPWLKMKCNFAVRYVVPNRDSILKLLEKTGQFRAEVSCYVQHISTFIYILTSMNLVGKRYTRKL